MYPAPPSHTHIYIITALYSKVPGTKRWHEVSHSNTEKRPVGRKEKREADSLFGMQDYKCLKKSLKSRPTSQCGHHLRLPWDAPRSHCTQTHPSLNHRTNSGGSLPKQLRKHTRNADCVGYPDSGRWEAVRGIHYDHREGQNEMRRIF